MSQPKRLNGKYRRFANRPNALLGLRKPKRALDQAVNVAQALLPVLAPILEDKHAGKSARATSFAGREPL